MYETLAEFRSVYVNNLTNFCTPFNVVSVTFKFRTR